MVTGVCHVRKTIANFYVIVLYAFPIVINDFDKLLPDYKPKHFFVRIKPTIELKNKNVN